MKKGKILVKIHGTCNQNPNGEMTISYIIEYPDKNTDICHEFIEAKYGNSLYTAEYMALNKALEKLISIGKTKEEIEIHTTSLMISLHKLGYMRPNKGYYIREALLATKNLKRFLSIKIEKVSRGENLEVINISKEPNNLQVIS